MSSGKIRLLMPENERRDAMQLLLDINKAAMATFDVLDAGWIDEGDVEVMLSMTDMHNAFIGMMKRQAERRMEAVR